MPPARKLCRAAALALATALPAAAGGGAAARADSIDLSMPRTVVVGAPRGDAPSERLDPSRTGRARTRLPATPVEIWRRHVSGNIDVSPIVDAADDVIVALTIPEIVKLGPDARELWRARLGNAAALAPPTLLSDGTIAVVNAAGIAWGFTPGGAVRFVTPLGIPRRDADTAPLALADGGLLVAAGNMVVEIDADGAVRARAALDERAAAGERAAGAVLDSPCHAGHDGGDPHTPGPAGHDGGDPHTPGPAGHDGGDPHTPGPAGHDGGNPHTPGPGALCGALITTAAGNVYRFRPPAAPRKVGSFGGTTPRGAALADERTLLAVVDGRRLVALDLPTGTAHVRTGGLAFDSPPTIGGGLVFLGTQLGMLLGVDAAGNERAHVMLDKPPSAPAAGAALGAILLPADLKPSPPLVIDPAGRIAFVRGNGRAGVVSPTGRVEIAADRVCAAPVAVLPAGDRRMLVACHDGALWMYGE